MRFSIMIFLLSFQISCCIAQTPNQKLAGEFAKDIPMLLTPGEHSANIMDSFLFTQRQIDLSIRLQNAFQKNYDWFINYMKTVAEGEALPYHEKMELTKSEYEEFLNLAEHQEVISSGKGTVTIFEHENVLTFKGVGRLALLDSLKINFKTRAVTFRSYQLKYKDTTGAKDEKNGLKSKWFGYKFQFEEPENLTVDVLKDLDNLRLLTFTLTIARLEKTGKTFLDLSGRKILDGQKIFDFRLPLIID